jgi:hypothetical protein
MTVTILETSRPQVMTPERGAAPNDSKRGNKHVLCFCKFGLPNRALDFFCGLGASPYFAALDKVNGRVDDNLVAAFDPIAYFHLRA